MSNYGTDGTNLQPSNIRTADYEGASPIYSHEDKNRTPMYVNQTLGYGTVAGSHLDHSIGGGAVMRNGSKVAVADYSEAKPTDIIKIDGMEITMEVARSMGLLAQYSGKSQPKVEPEKEPWKDDKDATDHEPIADDTLNLVHDQIKLEAGDLMHKGIAMTVADGLAENGMVDEGTIQHMAKAAGMAPQALVNIIAPAIEKQSEIVRGIIGRDAWALLEQAKEFDPQCKADLGNLIRRTCIGSASKKEWQQLAAKYIQKYGR
jgi:hypothetical protein